MIVYPPDCSLEEMVVLYIQNAVCEPLKEEEEPQEDNNVNGSTKEEETHHRDTSEDNTKNSITEIQNRSSDGSSCQSKNNKKNTEMTSSHSQVDPLLWAAFNESSPHDNHGEELSFAVDHIARCVCADVLIC